MSNKLVAVSQRFGKINGRKIDYIEHNYITYLKKFDVMPILIPNCSKLAKKYLGIRFSRVLLTGGNNINPKLYGSQEKISDISNERDATESLLLYHAIERNLPVLGICRGAQFINIYFGGKLTHVNSDFHVRKKHPVKITDTNSTFFGKQHIVNSYHDYGITEKTLSPELCAFATTLDGIVEGFYHKTLPIVGIMWHPERPDVKANNKLFHAFLDRDLYWKLK